MTSLTEVYEGGAGGADLRRLYAGVGLFGVGAVLTVVGIVVGTSAGGGGVLGLSKFGARELAGVLAGVGLPAVFLGGMTVLPKASWRIRAAGWLGAAVALVGVVAFVAVYPSNWFGMPTDYTLPVTAVYFVGVITTFWCLFVAVANFKARNDPGGTVRLEVTKEGKTRVVEVSNDRLRQGLGGIGLLGETPDGNTPTQTNGPDASTVSDGGAEVTTMSEPTTSSSTESAPAGPDRVSTRPNRGATESDAGRSRSGPRPDDAYCGNCSEFSYVRTDDGLAPYCGLHEEVMDDMDACSEWRPNTD
ncbi:DUF7139 domain-containing protein [Halosegnis marinus]|uniref:Ribonuclease BN n=1 Tax=Halosegnis marinus TaxID=3034023 RepID=A0ABD5ZR12_9EURY|nr:hypothetical protein [Halosegnis sp. DT85]